MGKYEMSHHLCGFFDAAVEDGQWVKALEYAHTAVTTRRYPQARLLRDIMTKILMVSDSQYLPPATKLGQGNIFRSVCQEFCSHSGAVHAGRYGQQAGGTHPTGMHTCFFKFCL